MSEGILPLAGVIVGWLLAQVSGIVKELWNRRRVRKCLLEELEELQLQLDQSLLKYARQLQIHALHGIDHHLSLGLSNHIFQNHYKEAVLSLNQAQRISYQMIHSHVDQVNIGIVRQGEITRSLQEKALLEGNASISAQEGEMWGRSVIAGFRNAAVALWHIRHHRAQPQSPDLSLHSDSHKSYLRYLQNVEDRIQEIMAAAKKLQREDFERTYRPEEFVRKTLSNQQ